MLRAVLFDLDDTLCEMAPARERVRSRGTFDDTWRPSEHYAAHVTANPEAIRVVSALRRQYPVGVVSNGSVRAQRMKLERCLGGMTLNPVVISGAVRMRKPDPAIFARALNELQLPAVEVLFVGDDPEADMLGASRAGLRTAWLARGRAKDALPCAVDHVLHSLSDVLEVARC